MSGELQHRCEKAKEIDRLTQDCIKIQDENKGMMMAIQHLEDKLDNHSEKVNERFDVLDNKINKINDINEEFHNRLSGLEKTVLIVKWALIGGLVVLFITQGGSVFPMLIKIFTKGIM